MGFWKNGKVLLRIASELGVCLEASDKLINSHAVKAMVVGPP